MRIVADDGGEFSDGRDVLLFVCGGGWYEFSDCSLTEVSVQWDGSKRYVPEILYPLVTGT